MKFELKPSFIFCFIFFWWLVPGSVIGQTGDDVARRKAALEQELSQVQAEIATQRQLIAAKQREVATLERDRQILDLQITQAKLTIRAQQLEIERLGGDIEKKVRTISQLADKIEQTKESLAELLRKRRDLEDHSFVEVWLDRNSLSDFFHEADNYQYLEDVIQQSFIEMRSVKTQTETAKQDLEVRRLAEIDARQEIIEERRIVERKEAEKRQLIAIGKNQQAAYRKVLAERERRQVEIKSALFRLRGSDSITFGQALDHANFVGVKTGVRSAFLMAVITQESNLGANVGTCNRLGDPPSKLWPEILKPNRDQAPFLRITKALSLDPAVVPLSCPQAGGWGGAMGPAQFIPSTWELYQSKITAITGTKTPNPWLPRDAFAASSLYLSELGAKARTWSAERTAALKYYAGSRWHLAKNAFYGNEVMKIAADYQELIETLQNN